jgi:cyclase
MGWYVLKRRIIPVQLLSKGRLIKTSRFSNARDVGDPVSSSRVYNSQYADELVFLNIDRAERTIKPLIDLIDRVSKVCFMPLAIGGGIRNVDDASELIRSGADKVILNTACFVDPSTISRTADRFGSQAIIAAIDVTGESGHYLVRSDCGRCEEAVVLEDHIKNCIAAGAGEILIQSIDRDGLMNGFDLDLLRLVRKVADVPFIALGGAGNYEHLREAFVEGGVSATACGSLFNFSDSNPMRAKAFLSNHGLEFKVV